MARAFRIMLACYAALQILILLGLIWNHLQFPLALETMEGLVWEHLTRIRAGQVLYPAPSPDFVALAYNPLYYYVAIPFVVIAGDSLLALRLPAVLGYLVALLGVFLAVYEQTKSCVWGGIGVGLLAAAYGAMDAYLDTAHADSCLLACGLIGSWILTQSRYPAYIALGLVILTAGFWFKQHGAWFVVGGVLYLTWRGGWRGAWWCWFMAAALGPGLYWGAERWLFGSHFHFYTFEMPHTWLQLHRGTVERYALYLARHFGALALLIVGAWFVTLRRPRQSISIWHVQVIAAGLMGLLGAMDSGSLNNVFAPVGTFLIVMGLISGHSWTQSQPKSQVVPWVFVAVTFGLLFYPPSRYWTPASAHAAYDDMITMLNELDGPVCGSSLGQLPGEWRLEPPLHWVALMDLVRKSGHRWLPAELERYLARLKPSSGTAYLFMNAELVPSDTFGAVADDYVLAEDFGESFASLASLPRRYSTGFPRYLYRYAGGTQRTLSPVEAREEP